MRGHGKTVAEVPDSYKFDPQRLRLASSAGAHLLETNQMPAKSLIHSGLPERILASTHRPVISLAQPEKVLGLGFPQCCFRGMRSVYEFKVCVQQENHTCCGGII
jgi:hypothetical protein